MDSLYKGLLKNYSVQLADTVSSKLESIDNIYNKIFTNKVRTSNVYGNNMNVNTKITLTK